jgi:putative transposase
METTKPVGSNFLQQQAKFDDFIDCYNNERPHQALNMQRPAERYVPSTRPYRGLPELEYPFHDRTATVTTCGRICFDRRKINLSVVFAGQSVGIKQVSDEIWLVSFMDYDLGYFDNETCRLEPIERHQSEAHGVRTRRHYDRDRTRCPADCEVGRKRRGDDHIWIEAHQIDGQIREAV